MASVNIILLGIVCCGVFLYTYIYPKKSPSLLFVLFLFSLLPIISIWRIGTYASGDLSLHVMRTMSFYHILFQEHILPSWTPEFNVGFGDPHFLFSYFLPYFLGSLFHAAGISFLASIKLLLSLSYVLSGVFFFLWMRSELGEKASFVGAIFYLFSPYHLVDLHFRVSIAETLAFIFLPLCLLFTRKLIREQKIAMFWFLSISYGLLILTHQIISLGFSPILLGYGIVTWLRYKKKIIAPLHIFISSLLYTFVLTIYYWLPILVESKYTQNAIKEIWHITSFPSLQELLFSSWRYGFLFQGNNGEITYLIGYTQVLVVILLIYQICKKQLHKKYIGFTTYFLILFSILFLLMLPQSKLIWSTLPLLDFFQYAYRLLTFITLCTAIFAAIVISRYKNSIAIIMLCTLTISYTILNWGNRMMLPHTNDITLKHDFLLHPDAGKYLEPSSPIWANPAKNDFRKFPISPLETLSGDTKIQVLFRSSTKHTYLVTSSTFVLLKENTLYFPGWKLFVNAKEYPFTYINSQHPGIILFQLPAGVYNITLLFTDTPIRASTKWISILTLIIGIIGSYYLVKVKKFSWR